MYRPVDSEDVVRTGVDSESETKTNTDAEIDDTSDIFILLRIGKSTKY